MKQNRIFIFIMLLLTVSGLSACSSQKQNIVGKYIDIYDESHYLIFNEDGSFVDNLLLTTSNGSTSISDHYVYEIDNEGLITIIDTIEYEGHDSLDKYDLGVLYDDNIVICYDGTLPINDVETSISHSFNDYKFEYFFDNDGIYRYTVTFNTEIIHTGNGTYTVNGNEVVCISEDSSSITFTNMDNRVFHIQYVKE